MRKRTAALIFCLLMILQLAVPPAEAAGTVCFMAAGIDILPLEDASMPFWYNGCLYVSSTIFTGAVNQSLKAAWLPTAADVCILYSGGRSLRFERGKNFAADTDGNTFYPGSTERNGVTFVPLPVVAAFFGFEYSTVSLGAAAVAGGHSAMLVWMRRPELAASLGLSDRAFANAASYQMEARYREYRQAQEPPPAGEDPAAGAGPEVPAEPEGKTVFLCLTAGENTSALLDALDAYGAKATFFCPPDFLESRGDLLRRMAVTGHAVGLLADGGDVPEQLEAGNRALERATMGKTRLALLQNGDHAVLQAARAAGYRCLTPDVDWNGLRREAGAEGLLQRIASWHGSSLTVWLAESAGAGGLRAFLSAAGQAEDRCLALTETAW